MTTLLLQSTDLARIRFAFSPLWECVAAFRTWQSPRSHEARRHWEHFFDGVEGMSGWPLLRAVALGPIGAIPDFLAPPPKHPFVRFADEIEALRSTPVSVVSAEVRDFWPEVAASLTGTDEGYSRFLDELADELTLFWQSVVAPCWPRVLECLEAEVVYRSRILAFGGTDAVLEGLHADVKFTPEGSGGRLQLTTGGAPQQRAGGEGLLLVPSVFCWPDVYAVTRAPWRPTLAYPARGIAGLWLGPEVPPAGDEGGLASLIGVARARVMRLLTRPRSTTDLAAAIGAAPSTISQHLTTLHAAGFLTRARNGRRVLYSLSERGLAVVRAADGSRLDGPDPPAAGSPARTPLHGVPHACFDAGCHSQPM